MDAQDGVDNWEEISEKELDSTVKKIEEETVKAKQEENFSGALLNSVQSTAMDKPVIILKRPDSQQRDRNLQNMQKPKTQMKSLHQRQQEYAEARMRILGSMPPDDGDFPLRTTPNGTESAPASSTVSTTSTAASSLLRR